MLFLKPIKGQRNSDTVQKRDFTVSTKILLYFFIHWRGTGIQRLWGGPKAVQWRGKQQSNNLPHAPMKHNWGLPAICYLIKPSPWPEGGADNGEEKEWESTFTREVPHNVTQANSQSNRTHWSLCPNTSVPLGLSGELYVYQSIWSDN